MGMENHWKELQSPQKQTKPDQTCLMIWALEVLPCHSVLAYFNSSNLGPRAEEVPEAVFGWPGVVLWVVVVVVVVEVDQLLSFNELVLLPMTGVLL